MRCRRTQRAALEALQIASWANPTAERMTKAQQGARERLMATYPTVSEPEFVPTSQHTNTLHSIITTLHIVTLFGQLHVAGGHVEARALVRGVSVVWVVGSLATNKSQAAQTTRGDDSHVGRAGWGAPLKDRSPSSTRETRAGSSTFMATELGSIPSKAR